MLTTQPTLILGLQRIPPPLRGWTGYERLSDREQRICSGDKPCIPFCVIA